jgi:hypothetical protein
MDPLLDPREDFAARNPTLYLMLGLLSCSRRLASFLPPAPAEPARAAAPLAPEERDALLLVVLGSISLSRSIAAATAALAPRGDAAPPAGAPPPGDLLR